MDQIMIIANLFNIPILIFKGICLILGTLFLFVTSILVCVGFSLSLMLISLALENKGEAQDG